MKRHGAPCRASRRRTSSLVEVHRRGRYPTRRPGVAGASRTGVRPAPYPGGGRGDDRPSSRPRWRPCWRRSPRSPSCTASLGTGDGRGVSRHERHARHRQRAGVAHATPSQAGLWSALPGGRADDRRQHRRWPSPSSVAARRPRRALVAGLAWLGALATIATRRRCTPPSAPCSASRTRCRSRRPSGPSGARRRRAASSASTWAMIGARGRCCGAPTAPHHERPGRADLRGHGDAGLGRHPGPQGPGLPTPLLCHRIRRRRRMR